MKNTKSIIDQMRKRHELDDDATVVVKQGPASFKADSDGDNFSFEAVITAEVLDRDREVVISDGVDTSDFDKSGAVFWNHDYDKPVAHPLGLSKSKGQLAARARFLRRPEGHQGEFLPDFARAFVNQGLELGKMPGVSIGFIPIEMRQPTKKDHERFGDTVENVISKSKLLEFSIAPVQSNPDAVVTAVSKGALSASAAKSMFGVDMPEKQADVDTDPIVKPKPKKVIVILNQAPAKAKKRKRVTAEQIRKEVRNAIRRQCGQLYE
jgi:hypothetical protein